MTLRHGYVTTWDRLLLIGVGHKKTAEIIKIKISMSQLGAAGSNGLSYHTTKSDLFNLLKCYLKTCKNDNIVNNVLDIIILHNRLTITLIKLSIINPTSKIFYENVKKY